MKFRKFAILVFSGATFVSLSSFCEELKVWNDTRDPISVMTFYTNNKLEDFSLLGNNNIKPGQPASIKIDATKWPRVYLVLTATFGDGSNKTLKRNFPIVKGNDIELVWDGNALSYLVNLPRGRAEAISKPK